MELESFFEKNASIKFFTKFSTIKYSIFCQKKIIEFTPSLKTICVKNILILFNSILYLELQK